MFRSQLENRKFKSGREEDKIAFKKQQNYCNRLYKKERKSFYNKLDLKNITDNIKFWDTMKPLFSDKGGVRDKIMLVEKNEIISDSIKVAEKFNNFFQVSGSMDSLGITEDTLLLNPVKTQDLDVNKCIQKFEFHPSIISIKRHVQIKEKFNFSPVTAEVIDK